MIQQVNVLGIMYCHSAVSTFTEHCRAGSIIWYCAV